MTAVGAAAAPPTKLDYRFAAVPEAVVLNPAFTDAEVRLLAVLLTFDHADKNGVRKGYVAPSQATLANRSGSKRESVGKRLQSLEQKGAILREQRRGEPLRVAFTFGNLPTFGGTPRKSVCDVEGQGVPTNGDTHLPILGDTNKTTKTEILNHLEAKPNSGFYGHAARRVACRVQAAFFADRRTARRRACGRRRSHARSDYSNDAGRPWVVAAVD